MALIPHKELEYKMAKAQVQEVGDHNNNNLLIGCSITRVVYIEVLIIFT